MPQPSLLRLCEHAKGESCTKEKKLKHCGHTSSLSVENRNGTNQKNHRAKAIVTCVLDLGTKSMAFLPEPAGLFFKILNVLF